MALPSKNTQLNEIADFDVFRNGGKGSGNFGHAGRPGERGGSSTNPVAIGKSFDKDRDGGGRLKEYEHKLREVEKALKDDAYRDEHFHGLSKERLEESKKQLKKDIKKESDRIADGKIKEGAKNIQKSVDKLSEQDYVYETGASVYDKGETYQTFKRLEREAKSLREYIERGSKGEEVQRTAGLIRYYTESIIPHLESKAYYSKGSGVDKMYKAHLKEIKKIAKIAGELEGDYYDKENK